MNKRNALKSICTGAILALSKTVYAARDWPQALFKSDNSEDVIKDLSQSSATVQSQDIHIKVPEIAENGAVVPITISSSLPDIETISILVDNNPTPLTSTFILSKHAVAKVSTRVKMAASSNVIALVSNRQGQHFTASKNIKVTIGGCGG